MKNADSLREEAGRSRRLGKTSADKKVKAALLAYALELEARAARMSAMTPPAPEAERREDQR